MQNVLTDHPILNATVEFVLASDGVLFLTEFGQLKQMRIFNMTQKNTLIINTI